MFLATNWDNNSKSAESLGHVRPFVAPSSVAYHAPLSMEFSRQQYWRGLSFPNPRSLSDPGIKPASLASPALAGGFFTIVPSGKLQQ